MTNPETSIVATLDAIAQLLSASGEDLWAARLRRLSAEVGWSSLPLERQSLVRGVLALYGGMGSFQDLVLYGSSGVLPEQRELDRLRRQLFEEAHAELR